MDYKNIKPIHIILKDGTVLDCAIYETGSKGKLPITDYNKIRTMLSSKESVHFQTKIIHGDFYAPNIVSYEIFNE